MSFQGDKHLLKGQEGAGGQRGSTEEATFELRPEGSGHAMCMSGADVPGRRHCRCQVQRPWGGREKGGFEDEQGGEGGKVRGVQSLRAMRTLAVREGRSHGALKGTHDNRPTVCHEGL